MFPVPFCANILIYCLQEADLPADRPYVFGYHPHGARPINRSHVIFANFTARATGIIGM